MFVSIYLPSVMNVIQSRLYYYLKKIQDRTYSASMNQVPIIPANANAPETIKQIDHQYQKLAKRLVLFTTSSVLPTRLIMVNGAVILSINKILGK